MAFPVSVQSAGSSSPASRWPSLAAKGSGYSTSRAEAKATSRRWG